MVAVLDLKPNWPIDDVAGRTPKTPAAEWEGAFARLSSPANLPAKMFAEILSLIARLRAPPAPA
jgi:hypothetical protein